MTTRRITRDVPPSLVDGLLTDYETIGAHASKFEQPDGNFMVVAVFDGAVRLARLARENAVQRAAGNPT